MGAHEKAEFSAEAIERYPDADPLSLDTYGDQVTLKMKRAAFDEGRASLRAEVHELLDSMDALHVTHSTTDVHHHGGIAGQAFTRHCAWQCGALEARLVDGKFVGDANRRFHETELIRYEEAVEKVSA